MLPLGERSYHGDTRNPISTLLITKPLRQSVTSFLLYKPVASIGAISPSKGMLSLKLCVYCEKENRGAALCCGYCGRHFRLAEVNIMDPFDFEQYVGRLLEQQGYKVKKVALFYAE
jgi:hypothetical protein